LRECPRVSITAPQQGEGNGQLIDFKGVGRGEACADP
jgi:hypothetical protein